MVPPPARARSERCRALCLSAVAEGFADAHRRNAADLQAVFAPLPDEEATVLHQRGRRFERDRAAVARSRRGAVQNAPQLARPRTRRLSAHFGFVLFTATLAGSLLDQAPPIETQASEWRSLTLNDGSFVSVGPHTQLRDRFGERQRLLSLSSGEALFQVAKDPSRPFIVDAGLRSGARDGHEIRRLAPRARRDRHGGGGHGAGQPRRPIGRASRSSAAEQVDRSGDVASSRSSTSTPRASSRGPHRHLVFENDTIAAAAAGVQPAQPRADRRGSRAGSEQVRGAVPCRRSGLVCRIHCRGEERRRRPAVPRPDQTASPWRPGYSRPPVPGRRRPDSPPLKTAARPR